MKDVPIKFRGKTLTADKAFVYGDLIQCPFALPIIRVFDEEECKKGFYAFEDYEVYPESVAQLVGYDADGSEVYEGDKLYYYHCFCFSGSTIRKDKIKSEGVCKVISADRLKGLYGELLNNPFDYTFLLKSTVDNEKKARRKNDC